MRTWARSGVAVLAIVGITQGMAAAAPPRASATVSRVPAVNLVCMVNDRFMGVQQIPVEVDGRTYYGCCPMCKSRLAEDKSVRESVDPMSGKTVDKAKAVVGRRADGTVLYFESADTLARYNRQKRSAAARPR